LQLLTGGTNRSNVIDSYRGWILENSWE